VRHALIFSILSALLLILSLALLALLQFPDRWEGIPFQWWIHIAILLVAFVGFWYQKRLRKNSPGSRFGFFRGLPVWLIALGLIVVFVVAPFWSKSIFDLGKTANGEAVHDKNFFESEGKYYLRLNSNPPIEISRKDYLAEVQNFKKLFACVWVLFSYIVLTFWQYLWRRTRAIENDGTRIQPRP
jgi:hypothetical protein